MNVPFWPKAGLAFNFTISFDGFNKNMTNTVPFHINTLYLITSPRLEEEGVSRRLTQ